MADASRPRSRHRALRAADQCPAGIGSSNGSTIKQDRQGLAKRFGFRGPSDMRATRCGCTIFPSLGSAIYGGAWATPAMRALFDDIPRTQRWVEILSLLAELQGERGVIPREAALDIKATCKSLRIDDAFFG